MALTEQNRINGIIDRKITDITKQKLKNLLKKQGSFTHLSSLKRSSKDFSQSEQEREIATHNTIGAMYPEIKRLVESLKLSAGNLKHYANYVKTKSVYKLRRYSDHQKYLYLSCYLYYRYHDTNDRLLEAFRYIIRKHKEEAKQYAQNAISEEMDVVRNHIKQAGQLLEIYIDQDVSNTNTFGTVRRKAFKVLARDKVETLSQHMQEKEFDTDYYYWEFIDKHPRKVSITLRRLFLAIDIDVVEENSSIARQICSAKQDLGHQPPLPIKLNRRLAKKRHREYLSTDTNHCKRSEFLFYLLVDKWFENHDIYIRDSRENKSLEDDLISRSDWKRNEKTFIANGPEKLKAPIKDSLQRLEE